VFHPSVLYLRGRKNKKLKIVQGSNASREMHSPKMIPKQNRGEKKEERVGEKTGQGKS